jgi:hypothetical protein
MDDEYYIETQADVKVDRIRVYYYFETPFKIKCTEEITFFNAGKRVESLVYALGGFKSHLHILDSDGTCIEFHSLNNMQPRGIFGELSQNNIKNRHFIAIDLPKNLPLEPEEYRTIKMEYLKEITSEELSYNFDEWGFFNIPLDKSKSVYLYSKKPDKYQCKSNFQIIFENEQDSQIFEISELSEFENIILEDEDNYAQIAFLEPIRDCTLRYSFSCGIFPLERVWFDFGAYSGYISAILIILLFAINPDLGFRIGVPLGAAIIAFLTVTKGWLFTKDMDRFVNIMLKREGRKITYDEIYLVSIALIFSILIISALAIIILSIYTQIFPPTPEIIVNNTTNIVNDTKLD